MPPQPNVAIPAPLPPAGAAQALLQQVVHDVRSDLLNIALAADMPLDGHAPDQVANIVESIPRTERLLAEGFGKVAPPERALPPGKPKPRARRARR